MHIKSKRGTQALSYLKAEYKYEKCSTEDEASKQ
jgi:hypothetical protein